MATFTLGWDASPSQDTDHEVTESMATFTLGRDASPSQDTDHEVTESMKAQRNSNHRTDQERCMNGKLHDHVKILLTNFYCIVTVRHLIFHLKKSDCIECLAVFTYGAGLMIFLPFPLQLERNLNAMRRKSSSV